jgi:hypothetical protein
VRSECPLWAKSGHDTHACVSSALPQIPDITSARCRIRDRERQEQFAPRPALRQSGNRQRKRHVRFGSLADICSAKGHVRFAPNSDRESGFPHKVMSALPPKADMCGAASDVRFGPIADIAPYSITSSASNKNDSGGERPSALAVLRLMTSSNLTGDCAGRLPGRSPLRMRST